MTPKPKLRATKERPLREEHSAPPKLSFDTHCKTCGEPIVMQWSEAKQKWWPANKSGKAHFLTCGTTNRDRRRQRRELRGLDQRFQQRIQ